MLENIVTALGSEMIRLDSIFVRYEVAYRLFWTNHFKNS